MKRIFLEKIVNFLWVIMIGLTSIGFCMFMYFWSEYREDVQVNRNLMCQSIALKDTEYCHKVLNVKK